MSTPGTSQSHGTLTGAAESEPPTRLATELLDLDRPECLRLLAATGVGRIDGLGLKPWAPGRKGDWIRIRANTVSDRRIASVGELR
jgi:hypothetical protein